jgi:TM2 domain-containing membrane protein YozV
MADTCGFPATVTPSMTTPHKNKTFATLLALVLGGVGAHRFYLRGPVDKLGLIHVMSLPIAGMVYGLGHDVNWFYKVLPLLASYMAAFIEALVIGLTPDDKWDARHNAGSGRVSASTWPLALLLVATTMGGAIVVIGTMARLFDLLYTGGAYG